MAALRYIKLGPVKDEDKVKIEVKVTYEDMLKEMVKETEGQKLTPDELKEHDRN